jgi:NodT family efflux transporter outer membrane factor (OMF) lipoprotein
MFTLPTKQALWVIQISLTSLICLCGCHITPQYVHPDIVAPPAYKEVTGDEATAVVWQAAQPADTLIRDDWWSIFGDPQLNALEARVNISNQNIVVAEANYRASAAIVRETRSALFPSGTIGASIMNNRVSVVPAVNLGSGVTYTEYSLPLEASWEPDLWGKIRSNIHSATYQAQANAALLESIRLAQHVQVALNYFLIHAQDSLAQVLDESIGADQETVTLTRSLCSAGLINDEAQSAADAQLAATKAQLENVRIVRSQYEHALAVLLGENPAAFAVPVTPLQVTLPEVPVELPAHLLERRPDIAAAERSVAAANAQIGIARSAYFPNVILSATFGFTGTSAANWLIWPSRAWAAGPSLAETIFDAGLRRATVQEYRYHYDSAVGTYRQATLNAFQQVEDNLAALRILHTELTEQQDAASAAQRAFDEATVRYHSGLDPYLNVIQTQQTFLTYRQSLVNMRSQRATATLNLILALGGGWDSQKIPSSKQIQKALLP